MHDDLGCDYFIVVMDGAIGNVTLGNDRALRQHAAQISRRPRIVTAASE